MLATDFILEIYITTFTANMTRFEIAYFLLKAVRSNTESDDSSSGKRLCLCRNWCVYVSLYVSQLVRIT